MSSNEVYKEKSKQTFDNEAKVYETSSNGKHAKKLYSSVIENVKMLNCLKVLDVGCGTGTILSELSKNDKINLAGVDLSENMINIAKKTLNDKVELKIGDSEKLPWKDNTFDAVICTDSFHHYPNPEKVLIEMARVLLPKGHLIIGDPWAMSPIRQLMNLSLKYSKKGDFRIYSQSEINKLFIKCGFNMLTFNRVNYSSFITTAEKILL